MIDTQAIIASTAGRYGTDLALYGFDPTALALATAKDESGFNRNAVGDQGHSVGPFQENDQGAGAGLTAAERSDPVAATIRFLQRVRDTIFGGFRGTPGEIAAAAQRPYDPVGYARTVNTYYGEFAGTGGLGGSPAPTTTTPAPSCNLSAVQQANIFAAVSQGKTYAQAAAEAGTSEACVAGMLGAEQASNASKVGGAIGGAAAGLIAPIAIIAVIVLVGYMGVKEIAG